MTAQFCPVAFFSTGLTSNSVCDTSFVASGGCCLHVDVMCTCTQAHILASI